jgi:hypothetical protein
MKSTYFSNKKSLQINSPQIRNDIKSLISNIGSFNLTSKYYTFLNKKNVNNLKENNFLVTLSTFGKKFVLFITKYNTKKYCIFINKKNDTMTVTQLKFMDDIFLGTLFDGELIKNNENKWIYLINDIAYYKGENIVTKSFLERQNIIDYILNNEHEYSIDTETLYISKKIYFDYKYVKSLVDKYSNFLNYKSSGLYFKNTNNYSDNYLFIFPECRSDSKILNNGVTVDNVKINIENDEDEDDEDDLFKDIEIIEPYKNNEQNIIEQKTIEQKPIEQKPIEQKPIEQKPIEQNTIEKNNNKFNNKNEKNNNIKLEKTTCRFLINATLLPDIYELYCKNSNNNIEKYSYASVPDINTSDFLKSIFNDNYNINEDINTKIENNNAIYVECNYHKSFKKWIPYKKVDNMDNINSVNQIQIILDSL